MTQYQLPRTDDGEVDWRQVERDWVSSDNVSLPSLLKLIDANARAEEREACAKIADEEAVGWAGTDGNEVDVCESLSLEIRARGDSQ